MITLIQLLIKSFSNSNWENIGDELVNQEQKTD